MATVTAASIRALLNDTRPAIDAKGRLLGINRGEWAAMRAVCRLYACQLSDEKASETTRHTNRIGFNQNHAKIGTALASFMDCGKRDGVMRRPTRGLVNKFVFDGIDEKTGKKRYIRFSSEFVGRDRVEICKYLAGFYAQQLADFANGDRRNAAAKVR